MLGDGTRGPQRADHGKNDRKKNLLSTCASPLVPHPSTGHVHGCLGSEIGRDPVLPTRVLKWQLIMKKRRFRKKWNKREVE